MAFSTFTSMQEMGTTIFPLALPAWFFAHRFDSLGKIRTIACPILLGHGRLDRSSHSGCSNARPRRPRGQ